MNKVFLIGNLTRDPELSQTTSGIAYCRFSIAVTRRFSNNEGERETDFINIVTWRNSAENCSKFLKKGSKVAVSGSIQTRNYEGTDGTKKYAFEVVADEVEFLTTKSAGDGNGTNSGNTDPVTKLEPIGDDQLPF